MLPGYRGYMFPHLLSLQMLVMCNPMLYILLLRMSHEDRLKGMMKHPAPT